MKAVVLMKDAGGGSISSRHFDYALKMRESECGKWLIISFEGSKKVFIPYDNILSAGIE